MIHVTRRYRFAASHRLYSPALSEEENQALYGKCSNPHGHGHDYILEITAAGPVDERSGLAVDQAALDRLVRERVLAAYDHRNMNLDIPEFAELPPTTENVAVEIRNRLSRGWRDAFPGEWPALTRVRIRETRNNLFEVSARSNEDQ